MAVITLMSASGSPGVTTAAVALGLVWPRPVILVEADPTGGSSFLAGFYQGQTHPGMVELMMAHQQKLLAEALPRLLLRVPDSRLRVLPGLRSHVQAAAARDVWGPLLAALRRSGGECDALVDAGRLGLAGWPEPLVLGADVCLLLTGSGLPELAAARSWVHWLAEAHGPAVGVVLAGEGRPYSAGEVARTLGVGVVATLPRDPAAARVWSHGERPGRRHHRSPLVTAIGALPDRIRALVPAGADEVELVEVIR